MDIQMPVMDGWQSARAIRSLDNPALAQIPIIALSANAFDSDIQTSMEFGQVSVDTVFHGGLYIAIKGVGR